MTHNHASGGACMGRRQFLIFGGAAVAIVAAGPKLGFAKGADLVGSRWPAKKIASLAELKSKQAVEFFYPNDNVRNFIVKLEEKAGAGVGPQHDIVAFNATCTHMGGPVGAEAYKPAHNIVGPCPLHLTTFDLTRHGMVVSGHATESLPQIMLEIRDGDVYAVGVMGLVFGYSENPRGA